MQHRDDGYLDVLDAVGQQSPDRLGHRHVLVERGERVRRPVVAGSPLGHVAVALVAEAAAVGEDGEEPGEARVGRGGRGRIRVGGVEEDPHLNRGTGVLQAQEHQVGPVERALGGREPQTQPDRRRRCHGVHVSALLGGGDNLRGGIPVAEFGDVQDIGHREGESGHAQGSAELLRIPDEVGVRRLDLPEVEHPVDHAMVRPEDRVVGGPGHLAHFAADPVVDVVVQAGEGLGEPGRVVVEEGDAQARLHVARWSATAASPAPEVTGSFRSASRAAGSGPGSAPGARGSARHLGWSRRRRPAGCRWCACRRRSSPTTGWSRRAPGPASTARTGTGMRGARAASSTGDARTGTAVSRECPPGSCSPCCRNAASPSGWLPGRRRARRASGRKCSS